MRRGMIAALLLLSMLGGTAAFGQSDERSGPRPEQGRSGQAAVDFLGERLPHVAARHGMTAAALRERLLTDDTLRAEPGGALFYVEPEHLEAAETEAALFGAAVDASQTFQLESRPGAKRVIYLDFDGHIVNSNWASYFKVPVGHVAAAYDTDGDASSFSGAEHAAIQGVWRRMSEDFAVFDVNVTTNDPGQAAITRSSSSDEYFGTRVAFSSDAMKTTCNCGGVAYVGVFDHTTSHDAYQPAWVFTTGAHNAAEAGSHEAGHTLGLNHDGTRSTGYYQGHGDWAPIMGVGYYEAITQWSKGEYSGANNKEDDFVVMRSNGIAAMVDDHGGLSAPTSISGPTLSAAGLIDAASDVDAFRFTAGGGNVSITVSPVGEGPNLDVALALRDSTGTVVATADPPSSSVNKVASGLAATLTTVVNAGTYTLTVDGTGAGDPLTNGYSDYGSVGRYVLSGSVPAGDSEPPPPPPTAPGAPGSVTASASAADVAVSWTSVAGADTYDVVRQSKHKNGSWVGTVTLATGVTVTTFVDAGPSSGTYRYLVRAVNTAGASAYTTSNEVTVAGGGGGGSGGGKGGPKKSLR